MLLRLLIIVPMACCGIFIAISSFSSHKKGGNCARERLLSYHP
jgi:hypothetical protein